MGCIWSAEYHPVREPPVGAFFDHSSLRTGSLIYLGNSLTEISQVGVLIKLPTLIGSEKLFLLEHCEKSSYDWITGMEVRSGVRLTSLGEAVKREACRKIYHQAFNSPVEPLPESSIFRMCGGMQKNVLNRTQDDLLVSFNASIGNYWPAAQNNLPRFCHDRIVVAPGSLGPLCAYQTDCFYQARSG